MSNIYVTNPIKVKLFSFKSDNSLFIKKLFIFIGIVPKNVHKELIELGNYIENVEYTKIDFNKLKTKYTNIKKFYGNNWIERLGIKNISKENL